MRSTKGLARHYVVLNRVGKAGELYEIQRFEYIEGDKFKTRKAAFRHANDARAGWQDKVYQYRNATMTLTDTAEIEDAFFNPITKAGKPNAPLVTLRLIISGSNKPAIVEKLAPTNDWPVSNARR